MTMKSTLLGALLCALCFSAVPTASYAAINTHNLGAKYNVAGSTITFRVYSSTATRMELDLFPAGSGSNAAMTVLLAPDPNATGVWQTTVAVSTITGAGITGSVFYGYRAWGPNWPYNASWTPGSSAGFIADVDAAGNRFNPNKLLFDPYALELSQDPKTATWTDGTIYASGALYRQVDSALNAPKGIVLPNGALSTGTKPTRAQKDDIIYEVNVRGLTNNDTGIAAAYRGTYKGAGLKAAYLASLGVTAVEFLPVQETQNDANDNTPGSNAGQNYWGYSTLNYFAPDRRYSSDKTPGGPTREFQTMVQAFHDAGIKVYIDVVYNHTGEGYKWSDGSTYNVLSYRGLDNPTYYELSNDNQNNYDNTGVGGNFNTYNPIAQNLIVDSLAYWYTTMGIDGFRFDLASVLGNTCTKGCFNYVKTDANNALNRIVREIPPRAATGGSGVDLIAEPWAIGGNSYQVGNFPTGWSEWNGVYRDTLRRAQNKLGNVAITPSQLATQFAGSASLFQDDGRSPWHSINFMVAHDGLTLNDLYKCNASNNTQAWPWGPSDGGTSNNDSWDQGGATVDQRAAARVGMAFLMLNAGTPMITGGDEFLRTLQCNNNAYNLDSVANWLNYSWSTNQSNFNSFTKGLIAFRKAHAAFRPGAYGASSFSWYTPAGVAPDSAYWANSNNHALAYVLSGNGDTASGIYVAYNAWSDAVSFKLPSPGTNKSWYRVTDACAWAEGPNQVATPGNESLVGGTNFNYSLCSRGLLVLIAK
jgi:glycogen operon protein